MCLLYPFVTDSKGITTHPFGQPIKLKFLKSPEHQEISSLQNVSISRTLNLIYRKTQRLKYLKDDLRHKKIEEQLTCKTIQTKQEVCSNLPIAFWHRKGHKVALLYVKDFSEKDIPPWSCPAFYVQKNAKIERGEPRLVINYKPLDKVLEWIRYPTPNKRDLVNRLSKPVIFSKFDMKSGF